jgi:hypothetical protein
MLQRVDRAPALAADGGFSANDQEAHFTADVDAFEAFFGRHERDIFGYPWRLTGDEQSARDLTQETFLRAWQRFDSSRHGGGGPLRDRTGCRPYRDSAARSGKVARRTQPELGGEALAVGERTDLEGGGERLPKIGE